MNTKPHPTSSGFYSLRYQYFLRSFITARERSTREANIFTLFVRPRGREYPAHWFLVSGPRSFPGKGTPVCGPRSLPGGEERVHMSWSWLGGTLVRCSTSSLGQGEDRGTPPQTSQDQDMVTPPLPYPHPTLPFRGHNRLWTGYTANCTPLAVKHEGLSG